MMKKLFLDFDGTLVDTSKAMLQCYPMWDSTGVPIQEYVLKWNFKDAIPNVREDIVKSIFDSDTFFAILELYNGVHDTLKELSELGTEITIVSVGSSENSNLKREYIKKHLPFCKFIPLVYDDKLSFDKSVINMVDGVFIDDRMDCLSSSNSPMKILYKHNNLDYEWSQGKAHHMVVTQWDDKFKETLKKLLINKL